MENMMMDESEKSDIQFNPFITYNKNCNEKLSKLIESLKEDKKSRKLKYVRDPVMLIESLEDINRVIGNNSVKESISSQINDIIADKVRIAHNPKLKDRNTMMNIMLYGPPGTGKTMLSNKIGKVMYSVGQLLDYNIEPTKSAANLEDMEIDVNIQAVAQALGTAILLSTLGLSIVGLIPAKMKLTYAILIIASSVYLAYYLYKKQSEKFEKKDIFSTSKEHQDRSYVTHATRSHFVAEYVGHSAIKTRKFLHDNIGKVIFLDEAYGLIQGYDDKFGNEAANEIIQFMANYPRAIVFIFAGYKSDIERTLFTYQSGFRRRFKYKWNCPGYTPEQLYDILRYQVYDSGWELKENQEESIKKLIMENSYIFKAYAGDIESVVEFSKMEHSENFVSNNVEGYSLLSLEHISKGVEKFRFSSDFDSLEEEEEIKKDSKMRNLSEMFMKTMM